MRQEVWRLTHSSSGLVHQLDENQRNVVLWPLLEVGTLTTQSLTKTNSEQVVQELKVQLANASPWN